MLHVRLTILSYCPHIQQLFVGFSELARRGVIDLALEKRLVPTRGGYPIPILLANLDGRVKIAYDCHDGGWIEDEYLEACDVYFKRSCPQSPPDARVRPLGLNVGVTCKGNIGARPGDGSNWKQRARNLAQYSRLLSRVVGTTAHADMYYECFEFPPIERDPDRGRVSFNVRLWEYQASWSAFFDEETLEEMNRMRIACVRACRARYGPRFAGGILSTPYARSLCPDLLIASHETNRRVFMEGLRNSSVCVATTGLAGSIGWKFAEYVMASRAIVSEPLNFRVVGDLAPGRNYLEFRSADELIAQIDSLLEDPARRSEMMQSNFRYYHQYLRPDMLVLNSLVTAMSS